MNARHETLIALMQLLSRVAREHGVGEHTHVVGGAVRDFLLGLPIKDVDVVIDSLAAGNNAEWFANRVADAIPVKTDVTFNNYGVAILTITEEWTPVEGGVCLHREVIEIANARSESYGKGEEGDGKPREVVATTIDQDIFRRDFTFNTLLMPLESLEEGPRHEAVIDLTGVGLRHLEERMLVTPLDPDQTFQDDPTRMLRAIKFLTKLGMQVAPGVETSIRKSAHKLRRIPYEPIGNLLMALVELPEAPRAFFEMKRLGLLDVISDMVRKDKGFNSFLARQLRDQRVDLLLALRDLGFHMDNSPLGFLSDEQIERLRELVAGMSQDEAILLVKALRKPVLNNRNLIQEFGLQGKKAAVLAPLAREELLGDPSLARCSVSLTRRVRDRLRR